MRLSELEFSLPQELIAQEPIEPRDHARLMVLERVTGVLHHRRFYEIGEFLSSGDVLVINDTKVIRARLRGSRSDTGGKVEFLLLRPFDDDPYAWEALIKPSRRAKPGREFLFGDDKIVLRASVEEQLSGGSFRVRFDRPRHFLFSALEQIGEVPLPPYIKTRLTDDRPYQTVYARNPGSVAAPTAGLHFTQRLLSELRQKGVQIVTITLHIGWATFKPISSPLVEGHQMGKEFYRVPSGSAETLNAAWARGNKVIAVGTTAVRTLETAATDWHRVEPREGWTELFITVGHQFKAVDALITNFHLPRSTNLLLVAAFCGGMGLVRRAYEEAMRLRYRFYSFGDAMLIL